MNLAEAEGEVRVFKVYSFTSSLGTSYMYVFVRHCSISLGRMFQSTLSLSLLIFLWYDEIRPLLRVVTMVNL